MKRAIIKIDESLCNGCGDCVVGCHEGALQIINGKAKLVSESFCDGLGACIGDCPSGALTIEERNAKVFDEAAVQQNMKKKASFIMTALQSNGCPGSRSVSFPLETEKTPSVHISRPSALQQWPVQLHLLSPTASFLKNADLLLSADCVAYTVGNFHQDHLQNKRLAIACPKLDNNLDIYVDKLRGMIEEADIRTLTVMTMEVPCCNGLLRIVREAMLVSSRQIPVRWIQISLQGEILKDESV